MKTRAIFRAYALGSKRTAPVGDNRPAVPQRGTTTESDHPDKQVDADHDRSYCYVRAGNYAGASGGEDLFGKAQKVYKGCKPMVMDKQEEMLDLLSQGIAKASVAKRRVLVFQVLIVL